MLVLHLLANSLEPYATTKYEGLVAQKEAWDCGPAAAATVLQLAGKKALPWPAGQKDQISLAQLADYLQLHGLETVGYQLNWQQLLHFFTHYPGRPLLAHVQGDNGHFVVLLGLVGNRLALADPAQGVQAVAAKVFLEGFSGYALYFPQLPPLAPVESLLAKVGARLNLLQLATP